jgi:Outer membrane protein beta-barrel domain
MPTRCVAVAAALTVALTAPGATAEDRRIRAEVLGGLGFTELSWAPAQDFPTTSRERFTGGVAAGFRLSERASLQVRAVWLEKSVTFGASPEAGFDGGRAAIRYVGFPVLFRLAGGAGAVRPYLLVGAELAVRTSAEARLRLGSLEIEDDGFEDDVASTDFGLDVGAGIEVPSGGIALLVEGLYCHGVEDIAVNPAEPDVVKTRSVRLALGLRF